MSKGQQKSPIFWWRTPFNALLTVPASLAIGISLLAIVAVLAERTFGTPDFLKVLDREPIYQILGIVAAAAMTALTLAYSLTLVVFTLAASSIGPRLLKRFTTERVNQITAGLLGGTFLYCLVTLGLSDLVLPRVATVGALLLAGIAVVQLIWFVRSVAQSVSVDDELAEISSRLETDLQRLRDHRRGTARLPDEESFEVAAETPEAGYLEEVDRSALLKLATKADIVLRIEHAPGTYLLKSVAVISVHGHVDDRMRKSLRKHVRQEPARSDVATVHFSLNLLVEIALRALSPGVNDTFTALAACDMLSGVMASIADTDPKPEVLLDDEGKPRVIMPGASIRELIDEGFSPIRRAAASNTLMAEGLARSYERLYQCGNEHSRNIIREHASILLADLNRFAHHEADINSVIAHMPAIARSLHVARGDEEGRAHQA